MQRTPLTFLYEKTIRPSRKRPAWKLKGPTVAEGITEDYAVCTHERRYLIKEMRTEIDDESKSEMDIQKRFLANELLEKIIRKI